MLKRYEEEFNKKIDHFKFHKRYNWLRKTADDVLNKHRGFGADAIAAGDFMDRIIAMPIGYIEDFLNDKNHLEWTFHYEKRLKAFKGEYLDVFDKYPDYLFETTNEKGLGIFEKFGYTQMKQIGPDKVIVGKAIKETGKEKENNDSQGIKRTVRRIS